MQNRHCPKCQAGARERWLEKRRRELLPTPYVHVVFTLPRELAPLALQNKKVVYDLLFAPVRKRFSRLRVIQSISAQKSVSSACCIPGVKNSNFTRMSIASFRLVDYLPIGRVGSSYATISFFPSRCSVASFSGKFVAALQRAFQDGRLSFHGNLKLLAQPKTFAAWRRLLFRKDWVVYSKRPFGGPEHVLRYLGRYTHRVAISNHRLISFADGVVTFRWRDSAHNNEQKPLPLSVDEFLRRFPVASAPRRFRAHSKLRLPRQPQTCHRFATLFSTARCHTTDQARDLHRQSQRSLHLPQMRWSDGGH